MSSKPLVYEVWLGNKAYVSAEEYRDAQAEIERLTEENKRLDEHCAQLNEQHHDALDEIERFHALIRQAKDNLAMQCRPTDETTTGPRQPHE